jgi:uncharacterized protein YbjT (DUF2867 family)
MNVVVAGASGFVGRHLVNRLLAAGHTVRCGTRNPATATPKDRTWVRLDVDRPETLDGALVGADALVYLVHQMGGGHGDDLAAREAASALAVVSACERAGVRRIVYLGGPKPVGEPSEHLAARLATGALLRSSSLSCIELRAAMIIGAGSESWTMVRDLALRLPVMVLPSWLSTRSSPVGVGDVVEALAAAVVDPLQGSEAFDLPGPECLSAREILLRAAATAGFRPVMIPLPVLTPSLSAHWLRLVTRADYGVASQLVLGLQSDLLTDGVGYWARMGRGPTPLDEVMRQAIAADHIAGAGRRWEQAVKRVGWRL